MTSVLYVLTLQKLRLTFSHSFWSHIGFESCRNIAVNKRKYCHSLSLSRAPPTGDSGALAGAAPAPRSCPSLAAAASLQHEAAAARDGPHNRQPSQSPSSLPRYSITPPRSTPLRWAGRPWQGGSASPGHGSGLSRWSAASPLVGAAPPGPASFGRAGARMGCSGHPPPATSGGRWCRIRPPWVRIWPPADGGAPPPFGAVPPAPAAAVLAGARLGASGRPLAISGG